MKSKTTTANSTTVYMRTIEGLRGANVTKAIAGARKALEANDNTALTVAINTAFAVGIELPAYATDKGACQCDKPVSLREFGKLIGRDHSTLSRWLKALQLIIENGDFVYFVTGACKFQFDKIILAYENKDVILKGRGISEVLDMSYSTLKSLLPDKKQADADTDAGEEAGAEAGAGAEAEAGEPVDNGADIEVTINGKVYTVPSKIFETFMEACTLVEAPAEDKKQAKKQAK